MMSGNGHRTILSLSSLSGLLIALLSAAACGGQLGPASSPPTVDVTVVTASAGDPLGTELDAILDDPSFAPAFWAVKIQDLRTGRVLYERDPDRFVMPASNMKLVTTAVALRTLGPDWRPVTMLHAVGSVVDGVLEGDLVLVGGGDPTLGGRFAAGDPLSGRGEALVPMRALADSVAAAGIERITGRLIGVDDLFEEESLGAGWSWDYLDAGYAAPIGALTWNENLVTVVAEPGPEPGSPATVRMEPEVGVFIVDAVVNTLGPRERGRLSVSRDLLSDILRVRGGVAVGGRPRRTTVSVPDPTRFSLLGLQTALDEQGIRVDGGVADQDVLPRSEHPVVIRPGYPTALPVGSRAVARIEGPPLSEILRVTNKESQNLYAETLLRLAGLEEGEGIGSVAAGRRQTEATLLEMGIPIDRYVQRDGSGLSRYNYLSAETLTRILRGMARGRDAAVWHATLPVMGVDGTLAERGRGSPAAGRVWAKTGSIANCRALSGYLETVEGDTLTFVLIANNFTAPNRAAEYLQDLICERLVTGLPPAGPDVRGPSAVKGPED
jgi:D-alanyl-D-alanine carboxypeptidase/D-alanyl-D-alanine-endopeptidase (penicillin-binding protein 4)